MMQKSGIKKQERYSSYSYSTANDTSTSYGNTSVLTQTLSTSTPDNMVANAESSLTSDDAVCIPQESLNIQ